MPRLYSSANDPIDFCKRCFPASEKAAFIRYGNRGDGPDDRGNCFSYNDYHPPYEDIDYICETCSKKLTANDN